MAAYPQAPTRKLKADESHIFNGMFSQLCSPVGFNFLHSLEAEGQPGAQEVRNERALFVYNRVQHKLTGEFVEAGSYLRHAEYNL